MWRGGCFVLGAADEIAHGVFWAQANGKFTLKKDLYTRGFRKNNSKSPASLKRHDSFPMFAMVLQISKTLFIQCFKCIKEDPLQTYQGLEPEWIPARGGGSTLESGTPGEDFLTTKGEGTERILSDVP